MADLYATIRQATPQQLHALAASQEARGSDDWHRDVRARYLAWLPLPSSARVIDVGCGTGTTTRALSELPQVATALGVDASPAFAATARDIAGPEPGPTFAVADASMLPARDRCVDLVHFGTCLCHLPDAAGAIREAFRVLEPGGILATFEGGYAPRGEAQTLDPFSAWVDSVMGASGPDLDLAQRLPTMITDAGFEIERIDWHGHVATSDQASMLALVQNAAARLRSSGTIGEQLASALETEAQRRNVATGEFGSVSYQSVIARRPIGPPA